MDDISRKKAPKRDVVEITRSGDWGSVVYLHRLSCGHVESRKRVAPAPQMACTWCVVAERKGDELRTLLTPQPRAEMVIDVTDMIDVASPDIAADEDAMRLKGSLSRSLGVPADAIDVVLEDIDGQLNVAYAVVFLSAADAQRLAKGASNTIIDI